MKPLSRPGPRAPASAASAASAAGVLSLIATGRARSRAELAQAAGISRSTVADRLQTLFAAGLVVEEDFAPSGGGRPTQRLRLRQDAALVLAVDIGEDFAHVALTDLGPEILAEATIVIDIRNGPESVLAQVSASLARLLHGSGRTVADVLGIGLGLPAPVDHERGQASGPSVLAGWDDYDIATRLRRDFDVPVCVENDVNLMTLAEARAFWPDCPQLVFIKVGNGIGSGIVSDGRLYRGAHGAAGDIGHIQLGGENSPLCRCGKLGCVEARAGGWAIARDLRALGFKAENARDVIALVQRGQPEALHRVREAGRVVGEVAACVVSVLSPSVIVVGGTLAQAEEYLFAGIRELVYQRALPLATSTLRIEAARSDPRNCLLLGAARQVIETQMQPLALVALLARRG